MINVKIKNLVYFGSLSAMKFKFLDMHIFLAILRATACDVIGVLCLKTTGSHIGSNRIRSTK